MKQALKILKVIGWIIIAGAGLFLGFASFLTATDFHPSAIEKISILNNGTKFPKEKKEISFFTWNIGYSGLGKSMDFFYEGGTRVRPEKEEFTKYLNGICRTLSTVDSVDFIFLQETDVHSKRSYFTDEVEKFGKLFPQRCILFAKNYDSRFVPVPLNEPMGRVVSGIACFPKFRPVSADRIDLGSRFSWPKQLVMLKRCLMVMHYKLAAGKELVVITLHNSTFDNDGFLRKKELQQINSIAVSEYQKGNYVITGGDWNNNPRGFHPASVTSGDIVKTIDPPLDSAFLPGWHFVFDPSAPSNRDVDMPYQKGKTKTTIIDFFVVSPNVEISSVQTITNGFSFSDHQPVLMKVTLK